MTTLIGMNNFAKRQTKNSSYSYYDGTEEALLELVTREYKQGHIESGYRDGVILVNVPAEQFYCSLIKLNESHEFISKMEKRTSDEQPMLTTRVINGRSDRCKNNK